MTRWNEEGSDIVEADKKQFAVRWDDEDFDIFEWDEYGQNDLTQSVTRMCHGLEPIDLEAIFTLAKDCEFSHMALNNARRTTKRLTNKVNKLKGNPK